MPFLRSYHPSHLGMDTASSFNLDGTLRENSSTDEAFAVRGASARRRQAAFNSDGTLRNNVSRDEPQWGATGGGMRHSPDISMTGSDHIGHGMNPNQLGSQHLPFHGNFSASTSGRSTNSAFRPDGRMNDGVCAVSTRFGNARDVRPHVIGRN